MSTRATIIPGLIDALVTAAKALLPDATVTDSFPRFDVEGDLLAIGVDDITSASPSAAASSSIEWATAGRQGRDETGVITCVAESWDASGDPKAARDAAYTIADTLDRLCRYGWATAPDASTVVLIPTTGSPATPTLNVHPAGLLSAGLTNLRLAQDPAEGARADVVFDVAFKARI